MLTILLVTLTFSKPAPQDCEGEGGEGEGVEGEGSEGADGGDTEVGEDGDESGIEADDNDFDEKRK